MIAGRKAQCMPRLRDVYKREVSFILLCSAAVTTFCGMSVREERGGEVVFAPLSGRTGYTFTGWTPAAITADMTGAQIVTAGWRANAYQIVYCANGGMGAMTATDCEYDKEQALASNQFVRVGYVFKGWAVAEGGDSTIEDGAIVKNFTSLDGDVVRLYAVWEVEHIETPVIMPEDGAVFKAKSCMVTINCATAGATIYYTTDGTTPRVKPAFQYNGPFEIKDTTTIVAMAFKDGNQSDYAESTITHIDPEGLTLASALGESKLYDVATGGDGEWVPIEDDAGKTIKTSALSGVLEEDDEGTAQTSWMEAKVNGRGTLSFWWRVSCDPDPRGKYTYDYAKFVADGTVVARQDGVTDGWVPVSVSFNTDGEHVLQWSYNADGWLSVGGAYDDCVCVNGVVWSGVDKPSVEPVIEGDEGATVTGDAETGFVIKPSEGNTAVEVTIPQGVDAAKVTVEVSVKVASIKPNGANVKIVSGGADITEFLNVPAADGNGVVDLTKATVKEEIVKETMDVEKGAEIELNAADPKLTTAPTRAGLFYQLREGETLDGMKDGDSKVGDGKPWSPEIKVKGGNSAFYSIGVGKGE